MKKILFSLLITLGIAAHSHAQQTINKSLNVDGTNRTYIVYLYYMVLSIEIIVNN